jgi:twitching motility two-component system response regulator PilH
VAAEASRRSAPREAPHAHRILVVEDDADLRDAMVHLLKRAGYVAIGAANGYEALHRLRGRPVPCLILLDLMLPAMDGWQFRRRQLEDPELARVPVIVCSAYGDEARTLASLHVEHYLEKPLDPGVLLDLIARRCARE